PFVGGIEQADYPDRCVDSEAGDLAAGFGQFELKQVVCETRDDPDVVEESADALAHRLRGNGRVSAADRAQHPIVELEVEGEHRLIESRQRIGIDALTLARWRLGGRRGLRGRVLRERSGV